MITYIFRRLLSALLTIWFIATATFFIMHAVPGDPLSDEKAVSEDIRKNLEARYGLDKPVTQQYLIFLGNLLRGDFGISYVQENREVNDIIREHFPVSATLGLVSLLIAVSLAVIAGAFAAYQRQRWPDTLILVVVVASISVPGFVVAALLQWLLVQINSGLGWQLLPVAGWGTVAHIWLPAIVLGLGTLAYLTRLMRSSMLEVMAADYSLTARSKGLTSRQIFLRHQLRNALLPVVTELGPTVAAITTGGFVVELVFAIPGMGRYFVEAVQHLDYTVIMGTTVFYGAFLVLVVLFVDLIYGWIDPRIRLVKRGGL